MLYELPLELIDEIVEHLHDTQSLGRFEYARTKDDFNSLSLVCQRFRHTAQTHLFRNVIYRFRCAPMDAQWDSSSGSSTQPWNPEWVERADYPSRTLKMLDTFLRANPLIKPMIKYLRLVAHPEHNEDIMEWGIGETMEFRDTDGTEVALLCDLLSSLPALTELELFDVMLLEPERFWAAQSLPILSLQRLRISYPHRDLLSDSGINEILGCFSYIDQVEILYTNAEEAPKESHAPSSMRIGSLIVLHDTHNSGELFRFLLNSPSTSTLRFIDIGFVASGTTTPVVLQQLLKAVGPRLEHFGCHLTQRTADERDELSLTDLSTCSNLRSVNLRVFAANDPFAGTVCDRSVQILSSCRQNTRLETVGIELHDIETVQGLYSWFTASREPISRLEDTILGLCRRHPVAFIFSVKENHSWPMPLGEVETACATWFPRLTEEKVIHVHML